METIELLRYIVDRPEAEEIMGKYLNAIFLREDVLRDLTELFR
jgi:hypothetical protein